MTLRGRITFDYSTHNGICPVGGGDALFETKWSSGNRDSIHIYNDPPSIDAVAVAAYATSITDIKDASRPEDAFTSRAQTPKEGQIVILRNTQSLYAALKILDVKASGHGDNVDEVTFDYVILEDGSRDFSGVKDVDVIDGSFSKRVLLIGAGFSRNWGGLMASEVGGRIMAHPAVAALPRLRELILNEPSFEDALEKTRTGLFEAADAEAMETAIKAAFESMDEGYKNPAPPVLGATINDFIAKFCPGAVGIGTGYVFSLNQDLLLERIYGTIPNRQQLVLPGITWRDRTHPYPMGAYPIPLASVTDPLASEPALLRNFNHIKLHGSINWRSSDGSSSIVIGRRKPLTIAKTPLLDWYHRVFESVICSGDVRLMVIGYGWADEHVNEPIANAVLHHRLQIYSWNPAHPKALLEDKHRGKDILPGIMGFTTRSMTEVMPPTPTSPGSADYDALVRDFF
jgi:hypothetical protein